MGHGPRRRPGARARRGRGRDRAAGSAIGMPRERIVALPTLGELLVGRPAPGRAARDSEIYCDWGEEYGCGEPDCAPGLPALRPLPRVLEPRLHGVRPPRRRTLDAAAEAEHRHRHGRSSAAAMLLQDVDSIFETDGFQAIMDWIARETGDALRRERDGDEGAPGARRPRARDDLPRRRRRRARRTRAAATSCAASSAAPSSRRARSGSTTSGGSPGSSSTRRATWYPELPEDRERIERGRARRGGAVLRDACARAAAVRGDRGEGRGQRARTRSRSRRPTASRSS